MFNLILYADPGFSLDDIDKTVRLIDGAKMFYLQQFRKPENTGDFIDIRNSLKPNSKEFFKEAIEICKPFVETVKTRGV